MHYRLRTYSPTLRQFLQRDPLGYFDSPNLYQYVLGNPVRYADAWGLGSDAPPPDPAFQDVDEFVEERKETIVDGLHQIAATVEVVLSVVAAVDPVVTAYELLTGKNAITDEDLSPTDYVMNALGFVPVGNIVKITKKVGGVAVDAFVITIRTAGGVEKTVNVTAKSVKEALEAAAKIAAKLDDEARIAKQQAEIRKLRSGSRGVSPTRSAMGRSGKPVVRTVPHATRKKAIDAAREQGKSAPEVHRGHAHPTGRDGEKLEGKKNVHHNFPVCHSGRRGSGREEYVGGQRWPAEMTVMYARSETDLLSLGNMWRNSLTTPRRAA